MSTTYAGADSFPSPVTLADDGDAASMVIVAASFEGALDRTVWLRQQMKRPKLVALGAQPFVTSGGHFALDYNFLSLTTSGVVGDDVKVPLSRLVHGATISSIDVLFVPKNTHAGLPGTAPKVGLVRCAVAAAGTPAAPSLVSTATYSPVSLADYNDGKFKVMTVSPAHVVDAEGYVYQLNVTDESGANAIVGNSYVAFRVNYA